MVGIAVGGMLVSRMAEGSPIFVLVVMVNPVVFFIFVFMLFVLLTIVPLLRLAAVLISRPTAMPLLALLVTLTPCVIDCWIVGRRTRCICGRGVIRSCTIYRRNVLKLDAKLMRVVPERCAVHVGLYIPLERRSGVLGRKWE